MTYEEVRDALDGLCAYDRGATDSGIHDEGLRDRVVAYLKGLESAERSRVLAKIVIDLFLSDVALSAGYGPEDARDFLDWLATEADFFQTDLLV